MRADVVVVGPRPTTAYIKLARLVVRDITDMSAMGHYVQALALQVSFAEKLSLPVWQRSGHEPRPDKLHCCCFQLLTDT